MCYVLFSSALYLRLCTGARVPPPLCNTGTTRGHTVLLCDECCRSEQSSSFESIVSRSREKIKNLCLSVDCSRGSANAQNRRADSGRYFNLQRAHVYLCTKQKVGFFFGTQIYIHTKSACIFVYQKKSWIFFKLDFCVRIYTKLDFFWHKNSTLKKCNFCAF